MITPLLQVRSISVFLLCVIDVRITNELNFKLLSDIKVY